MKKLILSLLLGLSLIASPVCAQDNNYWNRCLDTFHIVYEAIFAPSDGDWIQYIYNKYGKPAPAKISRLINRDEVWEVLSGVHASSFSHYDNYYKLTTVDELKRFLKFDDTDKLVYLPEWRDCDNFSLLLAARVQRWAPGLCFGMLQIRIEIFNTPICYHFLNVFIDDELNLWKIEPQTDEVTPLTADDYVANIYMRN